MPPLSQSDGFTRKAASSQLVFPPAKFERPALRTHLVPRPALLARMDAHTTTRLTLLCGPPGFGKTTLLSLWARDHATPVIWLNLDAEDNDPQRLLVAFVVALHVVAPESADLSPAHRSEAELGQLVRAFAHLPAGSLIVLDDYHALVAPQARRQMQVIFEHLPVHVHLAIASRENPALPLGRLRAQGELHELRHAELRFSATESAIFLREVMNLPLSDAAATTLAQRTEGWPAGLQLAALSLQGRTGADLEAHVAALAGSERFFVDYLTSEVLQRLPSHLHTFLLHTALPERICGPLCDELLGIGEPDGVMTLAEAPADDSYSRLILAELERLNVFLLPLDAQGYWYRYHTLFRDMLRQRLLAGATPAALAVLHERAAAWFAANGFAQEAAQHLRAAQRNRPQAAPTPSTTPTTGRNAVPLSLRSEASTQVRCYSVDEISDPLSPRELEVLRLIAAGHANRAIAAQLFITLGTVKRHVNSIFVKLGVQSRTQAVARGRLLRLLD